MRAQGDGLRGREADGPGAISLRTTFKQQEKHTLLGNERAADICKSKHDICGPLNTDVSI